MKRIDVSKSVIRKVLSILTLFRRCSSFWPFPPSLSFWGVRSISYSFSKWLYLISSHFFSLLSHVVRIRMATCISSDRTFTHRKHLLRELLYRTMYFFFYYFLTEIFPLSILLLSTYIRHQAPPKVNNKPIPATSHTPYTSPTPSVYSRYSGSRIFSQSHYSNGDSMKQSVIDCGVHYE